MKDFRQRLFDQPYPGRTLIAGMTPSGSHYAQVYWIMGRSANSRNRRFEREGASVKNKAFDPSRMEDPALIIYYPVRQWGDLHIVTNGDQTDTIHEGLQTGRSFEQSLRLREFEPDAPHYTPRISSILDADSGAYAISILKTSGNDPAVCLRHTYNYSGCNKGVGHCIHTYETELDGVLKPFEGEPFEVPLYDTREETADFYWNRIDNDNKIALLVKFIDVVTRESRFEIRNKHGVAD